MASDRCGLDNSFRWRVASRLYINLRTDAFAITAPPRTRQRLVLVFDDFLHSPSVVLVFCDVQLIIVSFLGFRLADLLGGAPPVALASGSLDEALATTIALPGRADHIDSHAARNYSGSFHDILLSFYLLFL